VTSGTPVITSIDFPPAVSNGPGTTVSASIGFSDPGRDISQILVSEIADTGSAYNARSFVVSAPEEGQDVVEVDLWTCSAASRGCKTGHVALSLSLVDLEGTRGPAMEVSFDVASRAPAITRISFPKVIPPFPEDTTFGELEFSDADGDLVLVDVEVVTCEGMDRCVSPDFDPRKSGETSGVVDFFQACFDPFPCFGGRVVLRFVLEDFAGNRSNTATVAYEFGGD
jgi:hypothetical protein